MKIGTYNIRNGDFGRHIAEMAGEIKAAGLDIVGLQEVDVGVRRSSRIDIPAELSALTGMAHHAFIKSIDLEGGAYGNGVLSAYPITICERHELPSEDAEQRTVMRCVIDVNGVDVNFFNTHLSTQEELRPAQFARLNELTRRYRPFILTGDFNIVDFGEYNAWQDAIMANTAERPLDSYFGELYDGEIRAIDNIIVSGDLQIANVAIPESGYSDHHLLVCEIAVK